MQRGYHPAGYNALHGVLLVAVLPANIHAATSGVTLRGAPPTPLVPRVALQLLFIGLVWWAGLRAPRRAN